MLDNLKKLVEFKIGTGVVAVSFGTGIVLTSIFATDSLTEVGQLLLAVLLALGLKRTAEKTNGGD